jgi:hypothetical protein
VTCFRKATKVDAGVPGVRRVDAEVPVTLELETITSRPQRQREIEDVTCRAGGRWAAKASP